jgi:hypothetical protein
MEAASKRNRLLLPATYFLLLVALTATAIAWWSWVTIVPAGLAALGLLMSSTQGRLLARGGHALFSLSVAAVLYVGFAFVAYFTFYGILQSYDTRETLAFKTAFWLAFASHQFATIAAAYVVGRHFDIPTPPVLVGCVLVEGALALSALWMLSLYGACSAGFNYPVNLSC